MAVINGTTKRNILKGTSGSDTISGLAGNDDLFGDGGNDTLKGGPGNDVLDGGAGKDQLSGEAGTDTLRGGAGADKLSGGAGTDTATYAGSKNSVTVSLTTRKGSGGDASGDTLSSIENLIGSSKSDTLTGNSGRNSLNGAAGNDILEGRGGADRLEGGSGNDFASYANARGSVLALLSAFLGLRAEGDAAGDKYVSIENLRGSKFDDALIGNSGSNRLEGLDGEDDLVGLGGNDILNGGKGDDTLAGGAGADKLIGGSGVDEVTYEFSTRGLTASLIGNIPEFGFIASGEARGDTYSSIEDLTGTDFNDILIGNNADNEIDGRSGNDALGGLDGDDILDADDGDDVLEGGAGADQLRGDSGSDWASYQFATARVAVSLQGTYLASVGVGGGAGDLIEGDANGDTYFSIENLRGSSFGDQLIGDQQNNAIEGLGGADIIVGGLGADKLTGGLGADNFYYGSPNDGGDTITDFVVGTDKIGIVNANFANIGTITAGNTFVVDGVGADTDPVFLYNSTTGVLRFDADGTGGGGAANAVTIATISTPNNTPPALTASDFFVI